VDHAVSPRRFFVMLVTTFAALGLLLAALGIFGIVSYSVTQRKQEIGIRMALGASTSQVQKHVIARAMQLVVAGAIIGAVSSFAVGKWIASLLFATRPTDPVTFLSVFALLVIVALAAGYVPARRASRIEPMIALRSE
jgi:ABC-type antimicrobial peptide transport system permease subunit